MARYCPYCVSRVDQGDTCPYCNYAYTYKPQPHHLKPGTVLKNKYLVGRVLGEGGFGITYVGRDLTLDMKVAIKEYYPVNMASRTNTESSTVSVFNWTFTSTFKEGKDQFINEAQTIAKMDKESAVVTVRDFFEDNNSAYIVMEFIEGDDLKTIINKEGKPVPTKDLLNLLEPLFPALTELHNIGLIHRDISPDNIMIENGRARLIDFGCARETLHGGSDADKVLKHSFSPLEQYENRNLGPWSDVYAMGATIYYCITGKLAPRATDRQIKDELVPPSALGARLSKRQEKAIMKALAMDPKDRYQTMQEFGKDLFVHRNYKYIAIGVAAAAVVVVGVLGWYAATHKGDTVIETMKVANEVSEIVTLASNPSAEERNMLEKVSETFKSNAVVSVDESNSYNNYYRITVRNDSGMDLEDVRLNFNFYDKDGTILGNGGCSISNWGAGDTASQSFYCNVQNPDHVEIRAWFDEGDKTLRTDYQQVEFSAEDTQGKEFSIELANDLPCQVRSNSYDGSFTYEFTSCTPDINNYKKNTYSVTMRVGGSLIKGSKVSSNYYGANYRVVDENGTLYDSGTVNIPALKEGERFENVSIYIGELPAGHYTLELSDYSR